MKRYFSLLFLFFLLKGTSTIAQKSDTVLVEPSTLNTNLVMEGSHQYLVYVIMEKDGTRKHTQFWTRTIKRSMLNDKPIINITQKWEDKDSIVHTVNSVCDANTFRPILHSFWWKQGGSTMVDFENKKIVQNGNPITKVDTAKQKKAIWSSFASAVDTYALNWHLNMEVFSTLPYRKGVTFRIPFYDPGTCLALKYVHYTVAGSGMLKGYDAEEIECWMLVLEDPDNKEVYWISKKTREVLKLEQEAMGGMKRYKLKLALDK